MCNKWNVHINCLGILILWLVYINTVECNYWTPSLFQNITRIRRQTNGCKFDEFRCKDGSCIADDLPCDGKDDCKDGSDETVECKGVVCNPAFGFRCEYGACIPKKSRCNKITECKDNSDEKGCPNSITNSCVITQFACHSGECINDQLLCDGVANCPDNSDETVEECAGLNCVNAFRCKYGACVNKNARCNNIKDCFDGSDEQGCPNTTSKPVTPATPKPPVTPPPVQPTDGSCMVPKVPANAVFVKTDSPLTTFKPGEYIPNYRALVMKCDPKFKTTPPNRNFPICINGKWNSAPLECARFCPSSNSSKATKITCKFGSIPLESCVEPVESTIANIKCEYLYEGESGNPNRICRDGTWDYPILECRPICGQKRAIGNTNIVGGNIAVKGDYPWHVGIYANDEQKTHLCGGSIVNQVVIVSAAHCFTDNEGNLLAKENYLIAAGKYYRPYDEKRDIYAQYATIKELHKPDRYKGPIGHYEGDIAVVILTRPLSITIAVQPVCVDWNTEFEYQQLYESNVGVVVGWGYTVKGEKPSLELKELDTPYIPYDQCFDQVPKDFRKFLTYDKVCAGFLHKGVAVCQGDSGGGLTFARKFDNHFFLRGVVSTSPRSENSCDPDQYATYTLISKHIDFIKDLEVVNRVI